MRLAAISDMHGNAVAFEAVIADLKQQRPDAILCLGDVVMRGPQPKECVDLLRDLAPLALVRGNYDHMFTRFSRANLKTETYKQRLAVRAFEYDCERLPQADQEWLANLPLLETLTLEGVQTELFHAAPWALSYETYPWTPLDDLAKLRQDEATRLVLFGHMHHAFARQARGRQVVNPGAVGTPFDGDNRASYAIIDLETGSMGVQLRRVTYDIERAIQVAVALGMPDVDAYAIALREARYPYSTPDR